MRSSSNSSRRGRRWGTRGFSLAELLVVVGVIALLIAIIIPPLQVARRQAMQTHCGANLQQIGIALETARADHEDHYPLWDDGGSPVRYTWIDILVQLQKAANPNVGYCPADNRPDSTSMARAEFYGVYYPGMGPIPGIDYSYGIGVPLSAGGWRWSRSFAEPGDNHERVFVDHERNPAARVLAGDAYWSAIYNLGGDAIDSGIWNDPTQYDNTMAWRRHPRYAANLLMQDGHVKSLRYHHGDEEPVDTNRTFVWYPGEPMHVGPDDKFGDNWYPNVPPYRLNEDGSFDGPFPEELLPPYYTRRQLWTQIKHK